MIFSKKTHYFYKLLSIIANFAVKMSSIYVHIPYCKSRCSYCDFYSTTGETARSMLHYVEALLSEYALRCLELPADDPVRTIYVGGGTPSLLAPAILSRLIAALPLSRVEEFTVEVNPDDITAEYAEGLVSLGVNRVSMGVQSFVDAELRAVGRRHDARQAVTAVDTLRRAGITNISIDLIYGLPGQTLDTWRQSLERAVSLGVQHISAYNLSYEEGTRLWLQRERGEVTEADEETCVAMYDALVALLKAAGFEHYEISNFARPGFRSQHNSSYWDFTPYLGLGAGAHSFDGEVRRHNPQSITRYMAAIEAGHTACVAEHSEWWERYDELVMVALRTSRGLDCREIERRFGAEAYAMFCRKADSLAQRGVLLREPSSGVYRLAPQAVMTSDRWISYLMWD